MFHDMPLPMLARMRELEQLDRCDRADGTPRMKRLRQIPPEVGKFIAIMMAGAPAGHCIEIGTSAGYSTLWLALASRRPCHHDGDEFAHLGRDQESLHSRR